MGNLCSSSKAAQVGNNSSQRGARAGARAARAGLNHALERPWQRPAHCPGLRKAGSLWASPRPRSAPAAAQRRSCHSGRASRPPAPSAALPSGHRRRPPLQLLAAPPPHASAPMPHNAPLAGRRHGCGQGGREQGQGRGGREDRECSSGLWQQAPVSWQQGSSRTPLQQQFRPTATCAVLPPSQAGTKAGVDQAKVDTAAKTVDQVPRGCLRRWSRAGLRWDALAFMLLPPFPLRFAPCLALPVWERRPCLTRRA